LSIPPVILSGCPSSEPVRSGKQELFASITIFRPYLIFLDKDPASNPVGDLCVYNQRCSSSLIIRGCAYPEIPDKTCPGSLKLLLAGTP
jgi:hypothetical protein